MKFQNLFDYRYFLKGVEDDIIDEALALRLKGSKNYEITDTDYFQLTDTISSYIEELKHHSKTKKFYKGLLKEELTDGSLQHLCACLTHLAIGLQDRKKVRRNVDLNPFVELRCIIDGMVTELAEKGKVKNKLLDLLKVGV